MTDRYFDEVATAIADDNRQHFEKVRKELANDNRRHFEKVRKDLADDNRRYFEKVRKDIADETRRYFEVSSEAFIHEIRLLARAVANVTEKWERDRHELSEKMDRGFAETQALLKPGS